ncbi:MAG TPA: SIS domain-containing protein [Candidatus Acidoferrum sp.]|jgi:glucosamine--fructose-6-phosphate aminotransferase (isomerizing)
MMTDSGSQSKHTLTEILSQPEIWPVALRELGESAAFQSAARQTASRKEWLFVGCGTSFYLAEAAAASWMLITGQRARALPGSEVLLFPQLGQLAVADLQAVVISRSGKTSEAIRAAESLIRKHKVPTIGVTCTAGSELTKICETTLVLSAADEKSMVMTRSFTAMLLALIRLAVAQTGATEVSGFDSVADALSSQVRAWNEQMEKFVAQHSFADYIYLAQGPFFAIAREAALKVTEMSCSYAQAYHTLEFRHGPKSIVAPQTCLTFFLSETAMQAESEVLVEMKALGGTIVAVCNSATDAVRRSSDMVFEFEADVPEFALLAPFIVPAQLLGFHTGVKKGFNPDEPKNLSRVVILD